MNVKRNVGTVIPLTVLLTSGFACSSAPPSLMPQPAPSSVIGCYGVGLGSWSANKASPNPPQVITLLDSIGTALLEAGKTLARPNPPSAGMPFNKAWWKRLDSEHLDVVFTLDGEVGVQMHFVWDQGAGKWTGTAEAWTDIGTTPQATASVTLSPRACG